MLCVCCGSARRAQHFALHRRGEVDGKLPARPRMTGLLELDVVPVSPYLRLTACIEQLILTKQLQI